MSSGLGYSGCKGLEAGGGSRSGCRQCHLRSTVYPHTHKHTQHSTTKRRTTTGKFVKWLEKFHVFRRQRNLFVVPRKLFECRRFTHTTRAATTIMAPTSGCYIAFLATKILSSLNGISLRSDVGKEICKINILLHQFRWKGWPSKKRPQSLSSRGEI